MTTVSAGQTITGLTVSSGTTLTVLSGGTVVSTTVLADGQIALSGGVASNTDLYGGLEVYSGGTAVGTEVLGGDQAVLGGGIASHTVVVSGYETLENGGTSDDAIVSNGAYQEIDWGTTSGTVVMAGGTEMTLPPPPFGSPPPQIIDGTILDGGEVSELGAEANTVIGGSLTFTSGGGVVAANAAQFTATIYGFNSFSEIATTGPGSSPTDTATLMSGNRLVLNLSGGVQESFQLDPTQNFTGDYFHLSEPSSRSVIVTENTTPCYTPGTLIHTNSGERPIEQLEIGDILVTVSGRHRPIRWLGRRSYGGRSLAGREHLLPVRITAGALGNGQPRRDLRVSPLHAMLLDGILVPAWQLVNGTSIVQETDCMRVEYIHIELETHDVIWAEGAASETFLDDDSRFMFNNASEHAALYPDDVRVPATYCAPRVESGYELESIRARLAVIASNLARQRNPSPA